MSSNTVNLSLLARGIGEVKKNGSERVDVKLEATDYFNYAGNTQRMYVHQPTLPMEYPPPIPKYAFDTPRRENFEIQLPKTFITRKGALLLFSEDFANRRTASGPLPSKRKRRPDQVSQSLEDVDFRTVNDFASSILNYGSRDDASINLKFVKDQMRTPRKVRPGFSARRYLSKLTKSFDDTFLETLMSKGHIQEKTLFEQNSLMPHLRRRINDDISYMPIPYRIMKHMLMAPGILSGYSFYKQRTQSSVMSSELPVVMEEDDMLLERPHGSGVQVVKVVDGVARPVSYNALTVEDKKNVLADLLVKSAINHALEKQKQVLEEEGIERVAESNRPSPDADRQIVRSVEGDLEEYSGSEKGVGLDIAEAVRSYIESQIDSTSLPSTTPRSQGGVKGGKVSNHSGRSFEVVPPIGSDVGSVKSRRMMETVGPKEYIGDIPVASVKDTLSQSGSESSRSSMRDRERPHLVPPTLSPIKDVSREVTLNKTPVIPPIQPSVQTIGGGDGLPALAIQPPTPQHSTLTTTGAVPGQVTREPSMEVMVEGEDAAKSAKPTPTVDLSVIMEGSETGEGQDGQWKAQSDHDGDDDLKKKGGFGESLGETLPAVPDTVRSTGSMKGGALKHSGPERKKKSGDGESDMQSDVQVTVTSPAEDDANILIDDGGSHASSSHHSGSVIYAPDGEIVHVGGSVASRLDQESISAVSEANKGEELEHEDDKDDWAGKRQHPDAFSSRSSVASVPGKPREHGVAHDEVEVVVEWPASRPNSPDDDESDPPPDEVPSLNLGDDEEQDIDPTSGDFNATHSYKTFSYNQKQGEESSTTGTLIALSEKDSTEERQLSKIPSSTGMIRSSTEGDIETREQTQLSSPELTMTRSRSDVIIPADGDEATPLPLSPQPPSAEKRSGRSRSKSTRKTFSRESRKRVASRGKTSAATEESSAPTEDPVEELSQEEEGFTSEEEAMDVASELPSGPTFALTIKEPTMTSQVTSEESFYPQEPRVDITIKDSTDAAPEAETRSPTQVTAESTMVAPSVPGAETRSPTLMISERDPSVPGPQTRSPTGIPPQQSMVAEPSMDPPSVPGAKTRSPTLLAEPEPSLDPSVPGAEGRTPTMPVMSERDPSVPGAETRSPTMMMSERDPSVPGPQTRSPTMAGAETRSPTMVAPSVPGAETRSPTMEVAPSVPGAQTRSPTMEAAPSVPGAVTRSPTKASSEWEQFLSGSGEGKSGAKKMTREMLLSRTPSVPRAVTRTPGGAASRQHSQGPPSPQKSPALAPPAVDIVVREATAEEPEEPVFDHPVSEEELVQTLTDHAHKIAANILSRPGSGLDLKADAEAAADMWVKSAPASRVASVLGSEQAPSEGSESAVLEFLSGRDDKSATPNLAEYKDMLKDALTSAVLSASPTAELMKEGAEVSPALIEALQDKDLSPEDIEIAQDDEGNNVIRVKSSRASEPETASVKSGASGSKGRKSKASIADESAVPQSIPVGKASPGALGGLDVVNIGEAERGPAEKRELVVRPPREDDIPLERPHESTEKTKEPSPPPTSVEDDRQKLENLVQPASAEGRASKAKSGKSVKSEKSAKSAKTTKSDKSADKKSGGVEHTEEFVVGKVADKKELENLYAPVDPPPKPKEKKPRVPAAKAAPKKGKKGKKKGEKAQPSPPPKEPTPPPKEPTPPPPKEPTPPPPVKIPPPKPKVVLPPPSPYARTPRQPATDSRQSGITTPGTAASEDGFTPRKMKKIRRRPSQTPSLAQESEEEMEFVIVRDEFSEEEEEPKRTPTKTPAAKSAKSVMSTISASGGDSVRTGDSDGDESDASGGNKGISNREARAKKRAAQAAKRREDVERKRREREEQSKREKEAHEQREALEREMEAERKRREDERRAKRENADREAREREEAEKSRERRAAMDAEREKRAKEEYAKKLEEMKKKQAEEDQIRREQEELRRLEDEERRIREEEKMAQMAEEERLEYLKRKAKEDEERKIREEQEKLKREEDAKKALEEARRLAEEMARKQAELEARMQFNRGLQLESHGMEHTQDITRAFVFSYFELLQWLGLDVPEFEALKRGKY